MPYQPDGNRQCRSVSIKHYRGGRTSPRVVMDTVIDATLHGTLHPLRVEHISVRITAVAPGIDRCRNRSVSAPLEVSPSFTDGAVGDRGIRPGRATFARRTGIASPATSVTWIGQMPGCVADLIAQGDRCWAPCNASGWQRVRGLFTQRGKPRRTAYQAS
jgi:hypothetical protein